MAKLSTDPLSSGLTLSPFDEESGYLHVIIDTPKASRNKYKFDEDKQLFRLTGILPAGSVFPFDFGNAPRREERTATRSTSSS